MSEYILIQIAKEHLPYEIDMLRGTFEPFKQSQSRPGLRPQALGCPPISRPVLLAICAWSLLFCSPRTLVRRACRIALR